MRTIHKYEIVQGRFQLPLPEQYRILHVDVQGNTPFMWVELNSDHVKHWDTFISVGTGWDINANLKEDEYSFHLGTWLQGPWVWHLYQIVKNDWLEEVRNEEETSRDS